jgi:hypothetical protein
VSRFHASTTVRVRHETTRCLWNFIRVSWMDTLLAKLTSLFFHKEKFTLWNWSVVSIEPPSVSYSACCSKSRLLCGVQYYFLPNI